MVTRLDTLDDVAAFLADAQPDAYITSRTHGRIAVPCLATVLVRTALVRENIYNPNSVAPDKMGMLRISILESGFCFPVVTIWDPDERVFVVVDGAHRTRMLGPEWLDCDYLPVVVLALDVADRLATTIRFNKARGVHQVDLDAEVIRAMVGQGLSDEEIAAKLAIDTDTVYRYKQVTGIAELFRGATWSGAWEMVDDP